MTKEQIAAAEAEANRLLALAEAHEGTDEEKAAALAVAQAKKAEVETAKRDAAAKEAELAAAAAAGVDDETARLLKDVMKWKEKARLAEAQAKLFEGIDPVKAKAALEAHAEAERKGMEARGEYDRIIASINETHAAELARLNGDNETLRGEIETLRTSGQEKDVATAFANSAFVRDSLTISGAKVRTLYGSHFEFKDGELIGYDKPKGSAARTPLVDGQGTPLPFEAALEKIVKADGEWERMAKSRIVPGPGGRPGGIDPSRVAEVPKDSLGKIAAGLGSLSRRPTVKGRLNGQN